MQHATLNLPFGRWIPIATQRMSGAIWHANFDLPTMMLIEQIYLQGGAWIMLRRVSRDKRHEDYKAFQRMLWLKTPGFKLPRR